MRPKKDETLSKTIGYNLKLLRKKLFPEFGRMKEMCDLVGVSATTWNKWEAGTNIPSDANQRKIAEVFGISMAELRGEVAPLQKSPPMDRSGGTAEIIRLFSTLEEAHGALADIAAEVRKGTLPPPVGLQAVEEALDTLLKVHGTTRQAGTIPDIDADRKNTGTD